MAREIEIVRPLDELRQGCEKEVLCSHVWEFAQIPLSLVVPRRCVKCGQEDVLPEIRPVEEGYWPFFINLDAVITGLGKRIPFGLVILVAFVLLILFLGLFGLAANIPVS